MPHDPDIESWAEYRRLILSELERLNGNIRLLGDKIDLLDGNRSKEISSLKIDVALIKQKAAWIGFGVGATTSAIVGTAVAMIFR